MTPSAGGGTKRSMAEETSFSCAVVTPEAKVFEGDVHFAALPAHDGEIGILRERAPLLCKLGVGILRIQRNQQEKRWVIDGGFAQMLGNRLTVLTPKAYPPDAIDSAAAQQALLEARGIQAVDEESRRSRNLAIARARAQIHLASGR